jgi:hydroxymethylpyrimidine/phosphomethylpyrimidine kinase
MRKTRRLPIALTIAGSDSGGGAGIQADLKTFASLGVHGTSAITCLTAQNPAKVLAVQAARPEIVQAQLEAVFDELPPVAVKTGMLYSAEIIEVVAGWFEAESRPPLVVDPVMIATSGAALAKDSAVRVLASRLLPIAALVTPNLHEAGVLIGDRKLGSIEDMRYAARQIQGHFGCPVLVKGGHLRGLKQAVDVLYDGKAEYLLEAPFIRGGSTHGTGCTFSAAITAYLALGHSLHKSVERAKEFITQAVASSCAVGRHRVLNSFWGKHFA